MSAQPKRRIHKLHLRASADDDVRRGALILEDAFHVASLPEVGGRVLILRSLNVGRFRNHYSSATMALAIEERIRQLFPAAVYAEHPTAANSPAVYFNDSAEPYTCLIARLARGARVDQWFWRSAVPEWQPSMPASEALPRLLIMVAEREDGVVATASIVRNLVEQGGFGSLLSALRWQDGVALLRASGWRRPELPAFLAGPTSHSDTNGLRPSVAGTGFELPVSAKWQPVFARVVDDWGADDPRTIWLAAIALISEKPSRVCDKQITLRAQRLTRLMMEWARGAVREQPRQADRNAPGQEDKRVELAPHEPEVARPEPPVPDDPDLYLQKVGSRGAGGDFSKADLKVEIGDKDGRAVDADGTRSRESEAERDLFARPTDFAGLYLLIPVMSRLGIATVLDANPNLVEWELAERLLEHIARLLGIAPTDPVLPTRESRDERVTAGRSFTAPRVWTEALLVGRELAIGRIAGADRGRVLVDGSGRLPLATWRGRAVGEVRDLVRGSPLRRLRTNLGDESQIILMAWTTAMRRYLRRHARIGLSELVRRPGRVSVTRTHVDVVMNNDHADPRIRRAGLDLNPGWVPWLGRVVSFHYTYGGI